MDDESSYQTEDCAAEQPLVRDAPGNCAVLRFEDWVNEWFNLADEAQGDSKGWKFDRDEIRER